MPDSPLLSITSDRSVLNVFQDRFRLTFEREGAAILSSGDSLPDVLGSLVAHEQDGETATLTFRDSKSVDRKLQIVTLSDGYRLIMDAPARLAFDLASGGHWYGQGEWIHQVYPLDAASMHEAPFMTWDNGPTGLGGVQEAIWFSSSGVGILVEDPRGSLQMGFNKPPAAEQIPEWKLTGYSPARERPKSAISGSSGELSLYDPDQSLSVRIIICPTIVEAHERFMEIMGKPTATPPSEFYRAPIWTTWARYKTAINQEVVMQFAREILDHGYPGGTMEIDDKWQLHYGDAAFDPAKFPDPRSMVSELNALGFNVTIWVMPFLSALSENTKEAVRLGYVVKTQEGQPYDVPWWQGTAYLLDVSNPAALEWWDANLRGLQEQTGLAGYKFDAGEANYLPADGVTFQPIDRNEYSRLYHNWVAANFPYCEVRCGWHGQSLPVFFRQWDKFSTWGLDNGLASIITTGLMMGMAGYPFVLPDMVGGNVYNDDVATAELMIRWTQASAPMLAIQFSLAPWDYGDEAMRICRNFAKLHVDLFPVRQKAAEQATMTGAPVIRPIFWVAPDDLATYMIGDQYMLGDDYLIAPVVEQGVYARNVYLPSGSRWRDIATGNEYTGGLWLRDYPAPMDVLPMFKRIT